MGALFLSALIIRCDTQLTSLFAFPSNVLVDRTCFLVYSALPSNSPIRASGKEERRCVCGASVALKPRAPCLRRQVQSTCPIASGISQSDSPFLICKGSQRGASEFGILSETATRDRRVRRTRVFVGRGRQEGRKRASHLGVRECDSARARSAGPGLVSFQFGSSEG